VPELLASRDASKNRFESVEHVDGTTFKLTGKSGDELIDIADIGVKDDDSTCRCAGTAST